MSDEMEQVVVERVRARVTPPSVAAARPGAGGVAAGRRGGRLARRVPQHGHPAHGRAGADALRFPQRPSRHRGLHRGVGGIGELFQHRGNRSRRRSGQHHAGDLGSPHLPQRRLLDTQLDPRISRGRRRRATGAAAVRADDPDARSGDFQPDDTTAGARAAQPVPVRRLPALARSGRDGGRKRREDRPHTGAPGETGRSSPRRTSCGTF